MKSIPQFNNRITISEDVLKKVIGKVHGQTQIRFEKHGPEGHASKHESYGIIMEEVDEMTEALRLKNDDPFYDEVMDVIVAGIWYLCTVEAHNAS